MRKLIVAVLQLLVFRKEAHGYFIPGLHPHTFSKGDEYVFHYYYFVLQIVPYNE